MSQPTLWLSQVTGTGAVSAAQLPLYNARQILFDILYTLLCCTILFSEVTELLASCKACNCCKAGGYFLDFYNVLDLAVMICE